MKIGLYVHIPFCHKKCSYCDFYSIERLSDIDSFVETLCKEIELRGALNTNEKNIVETLFFGGGTPSLLKPEQLLNIYQTISRYFIFDEGFEFSMECNPGTVTLENLLGYKNIGVNRLSFGAQSFHQSELDFLERIHTPEEVVKSVELARQAGFKNINIDLMFALPNQTIQSYSETLKKVIELDPDHISAYSLIYEEGTPLYANLIRGNVAQIEEEEDIAMFELTQKVLLENGYVQYEVSNYAKEGKRCKHNLKYWHGEEYISFGPSAHGYLQGERYWNFRNIRKWSESVGRGNLPIANSELIDSKNELFEYLFLALRADGINLSQIRDRFEFVFGTELLTMFTQWNADGFVKITEDVIYLTSKGYHLCDEITLQMISLVEKQVKRAWEQSTYQPADEEKVNLTEFPLHIVST